MRRRTLLATLVASTSADLARAQGRPRARLIAILYHGKKVPDPFVSVFRKRLSELGFVDGRDVRIEIHEAMGDTERLANLARHLVAARVDVIVAMAVQAAKAARDATGDIPIVMMHAGDPVGAGLVTSLSHPGGNVTGTTSLSTETVGKLVELIHELNPSVAQVAVLANPGNPSHEQALRNVEDAARRTGLGTLHVTAESESSLGAAFSTIERSGVSGLIVLGDSFFDAHQPAIVAFARARHLTDVYAVPGFPRNGGLAAYCPLFEEHWVRGAEFVAKLLNGAKPYDLPVEEAARLVLVVNMKTARTLGIAVPASILARADEVIE